MLISSIIDLKGMLVTAEMRPPPKNSLSSGWADTKRSRLPLKLSGEIGDGPFDADLTTCESIDGAICVGKLAANSRQEKAMRKRMLG